MSDQTPPPSEEPESVPTPEPVVYTPPADQPVTYTPAPPVTVPATGAQNGTGTAALIFGILQFFCIPLIGAILAIVLGRIGINKAKRGEASNGGMAKAGFWLGIVGLILTIIGGIIAVFVLVFAVNTLSTNTDAKVNSETGLADGQYQMDPSINYTLNDRCGFTGDPYDATMTVVAKGVTVSGSGTTECGTATMDVSVVRFDVEGGVARIIQVQ
ncbi:MAG: DUF4190 domain-containing protein [Actinomycetota bacterium]|nr:DUF4190 domain-containing protein [Actinomycetota bacterium]